MGFLTKLLPTFFCMGKFYNGSRKIVKNDALSDEEKYTELLRLEKKWGGRKSFTDPPKKYNRVTLAVTVGKKDIGRLLVKIRQYNLAIVYLRSSLADLNIYAIVLQNPRLQKTVFDQRMMACYHLVAALYQTGNEEEADEIRNSVTAELEEKIVSDPMNKDLTDYLECFE